MHLKAIEIQGFKSFARRVCLELAPGVTALVGPNGAGKSNVVDAIRWALGEQNPRALRAGRMEELLFAGSRGLPPSDRAEVVLTFDNADGVLPVPYREVAVARRMYRSGLSEYRINGRPCRLRDIDDLLAGLGLGVDGYALIGQGQVEELLLARPEELRARVEQAAGVADYRERRRQALLELASLDTALERLGDLRADLEARAPDLRRAAEQAARARLLRRRIGALELGLARARLRRLEEEQRADEAALRQAQARAEAAEARAMVLEVMVRELTSLADSQDARASRARASSLSAEVARDEERLRRLREEIAGMRAAEEGSQRRAAEIASRREGLVVEAQALEAELAQVAAEQEAVEGEAQAALAQLEALGPSEDEGGDLAEAIAQARERQAACAARAASLQGESEHVAAQARQAAAARAQAGAELQAGELRLAELERHIARLEEELADALRAEQAQAADLRRAQAARDEAAAALAALEAEHASLARLIEDLSDLRPASRLVLQAARRGELPGVRGAVFELVDVPEAVRAAVEAALGPAAEYIVVDDAAAADRAILYLKERRAGRATFLPIAELRAPVRRGPAPDGPGVLGVLADRVACEPHLIPAVRYLLGRALLVADLEAAWTLARRLDPPWRVVTCDGEILTPGGAVTGGSLPARRQSPLARRARLAELTRLRANAQAALAQAEARLRAAEHERDSLRRAREAVGQRLAAARAERAGAERALEGARAQLRQRAADEEEAQRRLAELAAELEALAREREELAERLEELAARQGRVERRGELRERAQRCRARLEQILSRRSALDAKVGLVADRLRDLAALEERLAAERRDRLARLQSAEAELADLEAALATRRRAAVEAAKLARDALAFGRALGALLTRARQTQEALRGDSLRLRQELAAHQARAARREGELSSLRESLTERFGRALTEAQVEEPGPGAEEELRALREELGRLGEVNPAAEGELRALESRLQHLRDQVADLLQGKDNLLRAVAEADAEAQARFDAALTQVSRAFGECVRELFGGGEGRLIPEGEGVACVVRPPGKRAVRLTLLSGGERSLGTLCLLFAFLRLRPSPFYVLDEVEAALDEANARRLARFLRRQRGAQFLIVTHQRVTMEHADILHGITTEEPGVSSVVSVRIDGDLRADEALPEGYA